jgi:hypothetical protein
MTGGRKQADTIGREAQQQASDEASNQSAAKAVSQLV